MPLDSIDTHYEAKVDFSTGQSPTSRLSAEHNLQPVNEMAVNKVVDTADWLIGIFLLIFILLAWIRVYHIKRLNQLFQAFLYRLHAHNVVRASESLITRISLALNGIFVLSLSVFIYQLMLYNQVNLSVSSQVSPFVIILAVVFILYPLKALLVKMLGWVFKSPEMVAEYTFNIFLLNKMLGLALIPITLLLAYLSFGQMILINMGITLIALSFLYRLYRGYYIGRVSSRLSQFYIFLYLCTLEILPLVVTARYISREL